jgi:hypothetical protein
MKEVNLPEVYIEQPSEQAQKEERGGPIVEGTQSVEDDGRTEEQTQPE